MASYRYLVKKKCYLYLGNTLRSNEKNMPILKHIGELEFVDLWKFAFLLLWMINVPKSSPHQVFEEMMFLCNYYAYKYLVSMKSLLNL